MFTFLFIDDSEDIVELGKLVLESSYECTVRGFTDVLSALEYIQNSELSCDAVICDYNMSPYNGGQLYHNVRLHRGNLPFILMSGDSIDEAESIPSNFLDHRHNIYLEKPFSTTFLRDLMLELFQEAKICSSSDESGYSALSTRFLSFLETSPVPLFAKIGDQKYIKIANSNELFCEDFASKVVEKYESFFTQHEDFEVLTNHLMNVLNCTSYKTVLGATELAHRVLSELGISAELIGYLDSSIESVIEEVSNDRELSSVLNKAIAEDSHPLYSHSVLAAYLSALLAVLQGYGEQKNLKKLVLAALFHDCALSISEFSNLEISSTSDGPVVEIKGPSSYFHHSLRGALYFKGNFAYTDVSKIIEQHHERPDGKGFPRGLGPSSIGSLSALFIVVENLAGYLVSTKPSLSKVRSWVSTVYDFYNIGNFAPHINILKQVVESNDKG